VEAPSLNGRLWRVPNHYGRTFSRMLKVGDNILMVKLANVDKRWTLEAWLRMADSAEPGDVEVVPVADFGTVAWKHFQRVVHAGQRRRDLLRHHRLTRTLSGMSR